MFTCWKGYRAALRRDRAGMVAEVLNVNIGVGLVLNIAIVEWGILRKKK